MTMPKMGSPFTITIDAKDSTNISTIFMRAFDMADQLNLIFSDYISESELSMINKSQEPHWINISQEMEALLITSQKACHASDGAFDISIGKITDQWKKSKITHKVDMDSIRYFKDFCGCDSYTIDTVTHRLFKTNKTFRLDVGGIAKGYIAEKVSNFLRVNGYPSHLVDAGGDLVVGNAPADAAGWKIAMESPQDNTDTQNILLLANQSIATSGSTYQNYVYKNKTVSHIIDPQNGKGISSKQNITVIAKNGSEADWLATACAVLGFKKSKKLISKMKGTSLIWANNNKIKKTGATVRFCK